MRPALRKVIYAVSFETIGVAVASLGLLVMSDASAQESVGVSIIAATVALAWSFVFNTVFEAWEARQPVKGRSFARRSAHALLFEGGLVVIFLPIMAWWLNVGLWEAFLYDAGLIVLFILYTYVFSWAFDRIFGLPASAQ
jgi:uncharacterized membrane protein